MENRMSGELQKLVGNLLTTIEDNSRRTPAPLQPLQPMDSMFSFRYTRTEISTQGGQAQIRHRETRFENGRMVTEQCEGSVDPAIYDQMAEQGRQMFAAQMDQMLRWWLPFWGRGR
jgi:hypothetical protein